MKHLITHTIEIVIGFSSGIVIGAGYLAIMTVLGVLPRLAQLSKTTSHINRFGFAPIVGVIVGTYMTFFDITLSLHNVSLIIWGFIQGIFIGMVAAALAEILNVFPLLSRRIGLQRHLFSLLLAIVCGKVIGSLFQWFLLTK